ncbi:AraC family transcriptional regulator, partial [Vibrio cincinnatiensis]
RLRRLMGVADQIVASRFSSIDLSNKATTHYSVNHIGRIVGYSDPLYFSRVFKRKAGVSPKQYREQIT